MDKISAHSNVAYWSYCPKHTKMGPKGSWTKIQLFLLGKVETSKYPEAETWHPESIDRKSYYRLCKHFWWSSGTAPSEKFRPNLGLQFFFLFFNFYLILQEFCDFSWTWNLHYLIFLRMQFFKNFWFSAKFLFTWFSERKTNLNKQYIFLIQIYSFVRTQVA